MNYLYLFLSFAQETDKEAGSEAQDTANQTNEDIQGNFYLFQQIFRYENH